MARWRYGVLGLVVLAVGGYGAYSAWQGEKDGPLVASGTIEATEVAVSPKAPGRIARLLVRESDRVRAGQRLAVLEGREQEAELRQAEAAARAARAALAQAEAQAAEAALHQGRMRDLFGKGFVSRALLDEAESRAKVSAAGVRSARAQVEAAEAAAATARVRVEDLVLTAPLDAVVLKKPMEAGEQALPGFPVVTLADLAHLWVRVYVAEQDVGRVRLGQPARVRVDSFPDRPFAGTVIEVAEQAEFTPRMVQTQRERVFLVFAVKVAVQDPEGLLHPGMPADVELLIKSSQDSTE
ncbi:MAG: efflux RND transporter periplasmic adaptor subunit [Nitrospirae bacterium]|nr:efflux RND transporter periplasmic adaptor subunit [Nitrospirota bacterium]